MSSIALTPYEQDTGIVLDKLSTADLRAELVTAIQMTAYHLNHLAQVWKELEARGEDLSALRVGMGVYLSKIAAGVLVAEIVVMYAGEPRLLRKASALPVEQQRAVAAGGEPPWVKAKATPADGPGPVRVPFSGKRPFTPAPREFRECTLPSPEPAAMAATGNSRDVAELLFKTVSASPDPEAVVTHLAAMVRQLRAGKRPWAD